jgi:hypothetical protein
MQQASVEVRLLDDWKGVTDPDKRRTIQNRLSKRAHREYTYLRWASWNLAHKIGRAPSESNQSTITTGFRATDRARINNSARCTPN